ncbi:hypothetical protein TcasGA2_TC008432 [Tribolium castaneum]|uniref:Uncharacterized protein n=1 Tax=Tribolium castaneum TaxID=7070 RepID=D2A1R0_TRICA|nr:hypothetical protein TcasGA2_TC008432 [Tribolium castaneum]
MSYSDLTDRFQQYARHTLHTLYLNCKCAQQVKSEGGLWRPTWGYSKKEELTRAAFERRSVKRVDGRSVAEATPSVGDWLCHERVGIPIL